MIAFLSSKFYRLFLCRSNKFCCRFLLLRIIVVIVSSLASLSIATGSSSSTYLVCVCQVRSHRVKIEAMVFFSTSYRSFGRLRVFSRGFNCVIVTIISSPTCRYQDYLVSRLFVLSIRIVSLNTHNNCRPRHVE